MCAKPIKDDTKTKVGTTGHSWDGIEELNTPLPRWWLWTFYLTILFAIGYTIAYPAWPLISGATPGVLGASTRADVAAEIQHFDELNAPVKAKLVITVANARQCLSHECGNLNVCLGGDLTYDVYKTTRDNRLHSNPRGWVHGEEGVQNGI